jgi:hypothetical protein
MADVTILEGMEFARLASECYPELTPNGAQLRLAHDIYVTVPKEAAKRIALTLLRFAKRTSEGLVAIGTYNASPQLQLAGMERRSSGMP